MPLKLLHTLGHLKAQQITGQIVHRSRKLWDNPSRVLKWKTPSFPGCNWPTTIQFLPPLQINQADHLLAGRMEFLNQVIETGWPPNWSRADLPRLWLYHLHYFDYLWTLDYPAAKSVVKDWIDRHVPDHRSVGWEPYPISLRLMNWCVAFFSRFRQELEQDSVAMRETVWESIYRQAQWLDSHVETHLMGNHVLENAAALTIAGNCFAGDTPRRWQQHGIELVRQQIVEQFLSDGGHYERSPMYQSRAIYVLLMLKSLGIAELAQMLDQPLTRAIHSLKHLCHPDGAIALFNDSAHGTYNRLEELANFAVQTKPAPTGAFALPETGYYGARTAEGAYIICDAGPIGPDHQPGHAHGDMLSFELSLRGHRVIVDSGVYDYEAGEMRDYCRSTHAHNTVEIDGQDQCEFWGVFRVARRGQVRDVIFAPTSGGFNLTAVHDGYARLKGKPMHGRSFRWHDTGGLIVSDSITSSATHRAIGRLHLHPSCRVVSLSGKQAHVEYPGGDLDIQFQGNGTLSIEDSFYCPQFGQKLANQALAWSVQVTGGRTDWTFSISESHGMPSRADERKETNL